ncbi:MAG: hypothetical protein ACLVIY_13175 [Anaerobutyricum soehngenii]
MKKIAILGSTGSIGTQTLDVVENTDKPGSSTSCRSNKERLKEQIRRVSSEKLSKPYLMRRRQQELKRRTCRVKQVGSCLAVWMV